MTRTSSTGTARPISGTRQPRGSTITFTTEESRHGSWPSWPQHSATRWSARAAARVCVWIWLRNASSPEVRLAGCRQQRHSPRSNGVHRPETRRQDLALAHRPEDFRPSEQFDVVFALSFFTHMPKSTFGRWLARLPRGPPSGQLAFTTHGLKKCTDFAIKPEDIPADGYWFQRALRSEGP